MFIVALSAIKSVEDRNKAEKVFTKYRNLMLKVAYRVLNDSDEAAVAVQETAIKIIKYLDKINEEDERKTRNFLAIICRRTAEDIGRKKTREKGLYSYSYEELDESIEDIGSDPMDIAISNKIVENIRSSINELPNIYCDVLLLKDAHECKNDEISELLKIPIETVKTRLARARKLITPQFVKEGLR